MDNYSNDYNYSYSDPEASRHERVMAERKARARRRQTTRTIFFIILIGLVAVGGITIAFMGNSISNLKAQNEKLSDTESRAQKYEAEASSLESQLKEAQESISGLESQLLAKKKALENSKVCYLTFDDGPSVNTPRVLSVLKEYDIKATFFVIHSEDYSGYLKDIQAEGHAIGLHSYTHEYSQIYQSQDAFYADINKLNDEVQSICGISPKILRFPGGASNTVSRSYCDGIMTALTESTAQKGYTCFDWNVSSGDASGNNVPVSTIMENIHQGGTSVKRAIVLMHDTGAKDTTVEALPQIISYYKDAGYIFASLSASDEPMLQARAN